MLFLQSVSFDESILNDMLTMPMIDIAHDGKNDIDWKSGWSSMQLSPNIVLQIESKNF